jgi:hypothetical protein
MNEPHRTSGDAIKTQAERLGVNGARSLLTVQKPEPTGQSPAQ